ncbi:hypothetical protein E1176_05920, partial [Fulvivirga sp. RKSG066]|nr:hypothetical protein [Fulvivirga aurantia]
MKSFNTITRTLITLVLFIPFAVAAQEVPQMVQMENLELASVDGKMVLTWETDLKGEHFLIEKLDENWDYVTVGQVDINNNNAYTIEDNNPVEGENYYRIT